MAGTYRYCLEWLPFNVKRSTTQKRGKRKRNVEIGRARLRTGTGEQERVAGMERLDKNCIQAFRSTSSGEIPNQNQNSPQIRYLGAQTHG